MHCFRLVGNKTSLSNREWPGSILVLADRVNTRGTNDPVTTWRGQGLPRPFQGSFVCFDVVYGAHSNAMHPASSGCTENLESRFYELRGDKNFSEGNFAGMLAMGWKLSEITVGANYSTYFESKLRKIWGTQRCIIRTLVIVNFLTSEVVNAPRKCKRTCYTFTFVECYFLGFQLWKFLKEY